MMGVLLPPIEAGSVAEYPSIFVGRPNPLKSIPAYGDFRNTGFDARVIFALQVLALLPVPALSKTLRASRTVTDLWRYGIIILSKQGIRDLSPLKPMKKTRSRACGTSKSLALSMMKSIEYPSSLNLSRRATRTFCYRSISPSAFTFSIIKARGFKIEITLA